MLWHVGVVLVVDPGIARAAMRTTECAQSGALCVAHGDISACMSGRHVHAPTAQHMGSATPLCAAQPHSRAGGASPRTALDSLSACIRDAKRAGCQGAHHSRDRHPRRRGRTHRHRRRGALHVPRGRRLDLPARPRRRACACRPAHRRGSAAALHARRCQHLGAWRVVRALGLPVQLHSVLHAFCVRLYMCSIAPLPSPCLSLRTIVT